MTAVDEDLTPVLVSNSDDEVDVLTVETKVGNHKIRVINGYGPQEDEDRQIILNFWQEIEKEVIVAKDSVCMVAIEMDANAKVGKEIIKEDPHHQTNNGKLLVDLVERQNLIILNALDLCEGVITRERVFENKVENSIIDYIIICQELYYYLIGMKIDDKKIHILTNYQKKKTSKKRTTSDHNLLYVSFSITFLRKPIKTRREFFNFKCEKGKQLFLEETNSSNKLSKCFTNSDNFNFNCNCFFRHLIKCFHKCFTKIRIKSGMNEVWAIRKYKIS